MKYSPFFKSHLLLTLGLLIPSVVLGQDYERVAPQVPETAEPVLEVGEDEAPPPEVELSREPVVAVLHGIILVTDPAGLNRPGYDSVEGIVVEGESVLLYREDLPIPLERFLGEPLSEYSLREMQWALIRFYRRNDYPVVDVIAPEQDLTAGRLQLLVLEGKVGEVEVTGARYFSEERLRSMVRLEPGEPIRASRLLDDLGWINRNPFRSASAIFEPGDELGATDIDVHVEDRFPLRVYTGLNDTGSALLGDERFFAGFNWGDVFGWDHQLNYQYTTDLWFDRLHAHGVSYIVPLPCRNIMTIFGSHSQSRVVPQEETRLTGVSSTLGGRFTVPLANIGTYQHELSVGFDFKRTNSNLEFGGDRVFGRPVEVNQLVAGYSLRRPDSWGVTSATITGYFSPGGISARNRTSDFREVRAGTNATYGYGRLQFDRINRLPGDLTLALTLMGQLSSGNLLPSEQLGVGGHSTVRGYDEFATLADQALVMRNELRLPGFSVGDLVGAPGLRDQLQLLAFIDHGWSTLDSPLEGQRKTRYLASIGPGIRWQVRDNLSLRADYGWQLTSGNIEGKRQTSRGHFSLTLSY